MTKKIYKQKIWLYTFKRWDGFKHLNIRFFEKSDF